MVELENNAIIVDPGDNARKIVQHISVNNLHVHAILATHGHYDHVGAAAILRNMYEVPFCIHAGDSDALLRINFFRRFFHQMDPVEIPPIDLDLACATDLRFGDLGVVSMHTPGHSPGSVCFEIEGALFTGDTLSTPDGSTMKIPGSNPGALRKSLDSLLSRYSPDVMAYPGHGRLVTLRQAVLKA